MEDMFRPKGQGSTRTVERVDESEAELLIARKSKRAKKSGSGGKKIATIIGGIVVLVLIGWGVYSYLELEKMRNPEYAEQQAQAETQALVGKVGRLMELPDGDPVVATVSDKSKLTDQPFFAKAEDGDKVLIYADSSMAIIYRESTDKIINSGPIAITSEGEDTETSATEVTQ
jgi:hypothetical protein